MKISRVRVCNYRSLKDVDIDLDDYAALVGSNGAGKSSLLYALDWFFNGRPLAATDVCGFQDGVTAVNDCFVEVTVSFRDLTPIDRERLEKYGRGQIAIFRRTWRLGERDKVVGNALEGPGFAQVRGMARVGEFRPAYSGLRDRLIDLPDLGINPSKGAVTDALLAWESDPAHAELLEADSESDAAYMFGMNGPNTIKECIRLVLIPASIDIPSQVGDVTGRGSALSELIGAVVAEAGTRATAAWVEENQLAIDELQSRVRASVETSTEIQAKRVNTRLETLIPNAHLELRPSMPDWSPKTNATVTTAVTIDGVTNDISRQGHGVQRAVMISMFEALVPDDVTARQSHEAGDGESEAAAELRLRGEVDRLPVLIVCIEEPEIYQHPIRARAFSRTLTELSAQPTAQVVVATHSPYFVRPQQFSSLRRFTLLGGETRVASTNQVALEAATGIEADKISKIVDKRLPTEFSEGFFADAVVLVEGDTDRAVVESLAARLGLELDARGISVIEVSSKESLRIPFEIFRALGVPAFVVADGDYLGAGRAHPVDAAARDEAHQSHKSATDTVVAWLSNANAVEGGLVYEFGDPSLVTQKCVLWRDDLEEELARWPSFGTALSAEGHALRRKKNLYAYRSAVLEAEIAGLPVSLRAAIEAIATFPVRGDG